MSILTTTQLLLLTQRPEPRPVYDEAIFPSHSRLERTSTARFNRAPGGARRLSRGRLRLVESHGVNTPHRGR